MVRLHTEMVCMLWLVLCSQSQYELSEERREGSRGLRAKTRDSRVGSDAIAGVGRGEPSFEKFIQIPRLRTRKELEVLVEPVLLMSRKTKQNGNSAQRD